MRKEDLAIYQYKDKIIEMVNNNQVVVVEAPTGSGKTTQIPQILFHAGLTGWGTIGVTQPRRIAAFSVSSRIAEEMNAELGRLVGYKMRFDDKTSSHTQIKIMTDGILLEELRSDPLLEKYSIIMVDEAHERSLNIDFILGLLKDILKQRKNFKVVVSSATINAKLFSEYFNNAPIISVDAHQFPVDIQYIPLITNAPDILQHKIVEIVDKIETTKKDGDILIFLEGEQSIKECCDNLEILKINKSYKLEILPLYARLAPEDQKKVFHEYQGKRKIVIATNIAETSITIDGIKHVIDPGIAKINFYNPRTFTSFLESKPISKASCNQRKGRAGRTAPGIVYRLYSKKDFENREDYTKEEIYRTDLSEVVLRMADLAIYDYTDFDFISPPKRGAIFSAIETLISIDALANNQRLTELGKKMVSFPLEPRLSRILLEAVEQYPKVVYNVLIIISFLSAKTPFLYPHGEEIESRHAQKKLADHGGDFFTWINLFYKFVGEKNKDAFCKKFYLDSRSINEIVNIHAQLCDMLREREYAIENKFDYDDIVRCVCAGLKQYLCKKEKRRRPTYFSMTEREIRMHPGSFLFDSSPDWVVGGEIVNTGRTYIRSAAVVPEKLVKLNFGEIYYSLAKKPLQKKESLSREQREKKKESANNKIYILDKYFDILKDKKGTYVSVPYQIIIQLRKHKEKVLTLDLGNYRSKLIFKDIIVLTDKLSSLVQYFDKIDLDNGINVKWPKSQQFLYPDDWVGIFRNIKSILKPTLSQHKSKRAGFLTLEQVDENSYQYYLEKDFFFAIETSLKALESIFSADIIAWNEREKTVLENIHHKLTSLSEEMDV